MLIELLVGLAVAAIAIGAAIASLLVARDVAVTVNELALLQQDASHAMRVLSHQIRTVGSNALQASPGDSGRFRFAAGMPVDETLTHVHGVDGTAGANDSVRLIQMSPPLLPSQQYDCLGQRADAGSPVEATFDVDSRGSLRCKGTAKTAQPLIAGVTAFKLRYRVRQGEQVRSLDAADIEAARLWPAVTALEVCLELQGQARTAAFETHSADCLGRSASTDGRLKLVTRGVFALRTQART